MANLDFEMVSTSSGPHIWRKSKNTAAAENVSAVCLEASNSISHFYRAQPASDRITGSPCLHSLHSLLSGKFPCRIVQCRLEKPCRQTQHRFLIIRSWSCRRINIEDDQQFRWFTRLLELIHEIHTVCHALFVLILQSL